MNTPGVTSVTAATVGQCNGSGNGGTSVGFTCTVSTTSTTVAGFLVNVDQCNGSANGGGARTNCSATVTSAFAQVATPTPTASPTASPTAVPTAAPTAAPTPPATVEPTPAPVTVPTPADTGNAGLPASSDIAAAVMLSAAALALAIGARRITRPRRVR